MPSTFHEDLGRDDKTKGSSERGFGLVFAAFCAIVAGAQLWLGHGWWPAWTAGAVAFLGLALFWTAPLKPLNRVWFKFGMLLHAIVSPLVMGLVFFTVVTPIGLVMRMAGKDPLRLKRDPSAATYWIMRAPPGPPPQTMTKQF